MRGGTGFALGIVFVITLVATYFVVVGVLYIQPVEYETGLMGKDRSEYQAYITPTDMEIVEIVNSLRIRFGEKLTMQDVSKIRRLFNFVKSNFVYVNETEENWEMPRDVLLRWKITNQMTGDCEEASNILVSLFRASGVNSMKVRVLLGRLEGTGHASAQIYIEDYETWLPLEPYGRNEWDTYLHRKLNIEPLSAYSDIVIWGFA